jgi:hypothetical protein
MTSRLQARLDLEAHARRKGCERHPRRGPSKGELREMLRAAAANTQASADGATASLADDEGS